MSCLYRAERANSPLPGIGPVVEASSDYDACQVAAYFWGGLINEWMATEIYLAAMATEQRMTVTTT